MIIQSGNPKINGLYVIYTDDLKLPEWGDEHLAWWNGMRWNVKDQVHGWIGPIPAFKHGETKPLVEYDL